MITSKVKKQILPQKRIGVIGGLGPRASAHFYKLIIDHCTNRFAAAYDFEYPSIIVFSISSFGLAKTGMADQTILVSDLCEAFDCFSKTNVDVIAIACNSVFAYYEKFIRQTKIHIQDFRLRGCESMDMRLSQFCAQVIAQQIMLSLV